MNILSRHFTKLAYRRCYAKHHVVISGRALNAIKKGTACHRSHTLEVSYSCTPRFKTHQERSTPGMFHFPRRTLSWPV